MDLSHRLVEVIRQRSALLIGDGASAGITAGRRRTEDLLAAFELPAATPERQHAIAEQFEARNGRNALIKALRAVDLPIDRHLSTVLREFRPRVLIDIGITASAARSLLAGQSWDQLSSDADLAIHDANMLPIFAPLGYLDHADTVKLTSKDIRGLAETKPGLLQAIRAEIRSCCGITAILDRWDVETFLEIEGEIVPESGIVRRCLTVGASEDQARILGHRGFAVEAVDLWGDFHAALATAAQNLESSAGSGRRGHEPGNAGEPFRYLSYFDENSAGRFFGRDQEVAQLRWRVLGNRLCILSGSSGVGKTSLVRAGLFPDLAADGIKTSVARIFDRPLDSMVEATYRAVERTPPKAPTTSSDEALLLIEKALILNVQTVVAIDQFEEVFTRLGVGERTELLRLLDAFRRSPANALSILLVVRDDMLSNVLDQGPIGERLIAELYYLRKLTTLAAREALEGPARLVEWQIQSDVVESVIEDLDDDGIDPASLQIVASNLFELYGPSGEMSMRDYKAVGGARAILTSYLNSVLDDIVNERPSSRPVLKSLVTLDGTKSVLAEPDIFNGSRFLSPSSTLEGVRSSLQVLVERRILRSVGNGSDGPLFELCHDLLAAQVRDWLDEEEIDRKYVWHLMESATSDWLSSGILPGDQQWRFLEGISPDVQVRDEDRCMLLLAALQNDASWTAIELYCYRFEDRHWLMLSPMVEQVSLKVKHGLLEVATQFDNVNSRAIAGQLASSSGAESIRRACLRLFQPQPEQFTTTKWIDITGGDFLMGTDDPDFTFSGPSTTVRVGPFRIQPYPVTCYEYAQFLRASGHRLPKGWTEGSSPRRREEQPVVGVSWYDAVEYCRWYSEQSGQVVRLPSEIEWEYAATWDPTNSVKRRWGSSDAVVIGSINSRESEVGEITYIGAWSPAGDGPCGAVEMCGNTFDWVSDWWEESIAHLLEARGQESRDRGTKAARGGSWAGSYIGNSGCSRAYSLHPENANEYVGFRMAADAEREGEGDS